ncbi:hypothetical protein TWF506_001013 [Arthrobotrys conoides]|uniref:MYND-type domain-containing protein n=1 Tax=Arthrobotrys conoides TaxID=74498 RepID=A0AAN8PRJ4_9PEZI
MNRVIPPYGQKGYLESKLAPDDSCVICNKHPANTCKQCQSIWYCSKTCQKSDWPSHKLLCKPFTNQEPRPSPDHKRAILFPADEEKPRLIWVFCERNSDPWEISDHMHTEDYIPADTPPGYARADYNPITNRRLGSGFSTQRLNDGYTILFQFRDGFSIDGSAINQSVLTAIGRSGQTPGYIWCGPVIAIREPEANFCGDVNLGDFRHIIDFLITYNRS